MAIMIKGDPGFIEINKIRTDNNGQTAEQERKLQFARLQLSRLLKGVV
jgi:hypothetical protein